MILGRLSAADSVGGAARARRRAGRKKGLMFNPWLGIWRESDGKKGFMRESYLPTPRRLSISLPEVVFEPVRGAPLFNSGSFRVEDIHFHAGETRSSRRQMQTDDTQPLGWAGGLKGALSGPGTIGDSDSFRCPVLQVRG